MSELCGFVYNKGHQKSRETTREIWRSEGEMCISSVTRVTQKKEIRVQTTELKLWLLSF